MQLTHRFYSYMTTIIWGLTCKEERRQQGQVQPVYSYKPGCQSHARTDVQELDLASSGVQGSPSQSKHAVRSLARALEDNFVLLAFDFEPVSLYPIIHNNSIFNRAIDCVLNPSMNEESIRTPRLLSESESLLDVVADVSGKQCEECRSLVQAGIN